MGRQISRVLRRLWQLSRDCGVLGQCDGLGQWGKNKPRFQEFETYHNKFHSISLHDCWVPIESNIQRQTQPKNCIMALVFYCGSPGNLECALIFSGNNQHRKYKISEFLENFYTLETSSWKLWDLKTPVGEIFRFPVKVFTTRGRCSVLTRPGVGCHLCHTEPHHGGRTSIPIGVMLRREASHPRYQGQTTPIHSPQWPQAWTLSFLTHQFSISGPTYHFNMALPSLALVLSS